MKNDLQILENILAMQFGDQDKQLFVCFDFINCLNFALSSHPSNSAAEEIIFCNPAAGKKFFLRLKGATEFHYALWQHRTLLYTFSFKRSPATSSENFALSYDYQANCEVGRSKKM